MTGRCGHTGKPNARKSAPRPATPGQRRAIAWPMRLPPEKPSLSPNQNQPLTHFIHPKETVMKSSKVLVVMSGAHLLELKDNKVYATGYYLNELATPLRALIAAGYTPVFASPNGDAPTMDASSNKAMFFGNDDVKRMETLRFIDGFAGLRHPLKLSDVAGHTEDFAGVFVPGGHAPMVDLVKTRDLGKILLDFHRTSRPTALICHGPMALLSTLAESEQFDRALNAGETGALAALAHGWPYAGYKIAVFSKSEEQQIEPGQLE